MTRETIASRATTASGEKFFKSYVKGIKLSEVREIPEHVEGWVEKDYLFHYKDEDYKIIQHIVPNKDGEVKYSAKYVYTLVKY